MTPLLGAPQDADCLHRLQRGGLPHASLEMPIGGPFTKHSDPGEVEQKPGLASAGQDALGGYSMCRDGDSTTNRGGYSDEIRGTLGKKGWAR